MEYVEEGTVDAMKKYFLSANTSEGYVSFYDETANRLERMYAISGVPEASASKIIKDIAVSKGADELILNPMNTEMADGCIWRERGIGVFGERIKSEPVFGVNHNGLYGAYGEAKKIHDEWEKIYIENMDIKRLNGYCDKVISELLGNKLGSGEPEDVSRFFGASTPVKPINFINELTEDIKARYFIKGRPGTGKSTFLKRFRKEAADRGFDTETYYCSFDPKSLDMVVVRELSLCIFDSTAPHEMFPESERDKILDFYTEAGLTGIDEKYEKQLKEIEKAYREKMKEGVAFLGNICTGVSGKEDKGAEKSIYKMLADKFL